jgi:hypothetical protein
MPLRAILSEQETMGGEPPEEQEPQLGGGGDQEEQSSSTRDDDDDDDDDDDGDDSDDQLQQLLPLAESNPPSPSAPGSPPRVPPRAREHSYLPGASHPLFPDSLRERQKVVVRRCPRRPNQQQPPPLRADGLDQSNNDMSIDTAVGLPLAAIDDEDDNDMDDMDDSYNDMNYIGNTNDKNHLTELAVLELPSVVLFPGSTIPIRLTDRNWIDYLGRQIEASRSLQAPAGSQTKSPLEPVRLGVLTRIASPQENRTTAVRNRRQSWTRRGLGPIRLRRLSEQIVLELGDLLESGDEQEDDNNDNDGGTDTDTTTNNSSERRRNRPEPPADERRESRRQRTTGNVKKARHPYIGRIGTIASVTYTHGDAATDDDTVVNGSSRVWRSSREQGQLVVTALGTSRFRIDSFAHEEDANAMARDPDYARSHFMGVRTFLVEELDDEPLSLPPLQLRHCEPNGVLAGNNFQRYHNRLIQRLSIVSPYPPFVYQLAWPWKMVADILEAVKRVSTFTGLSQSLPSLDDDTCDNDTHRFLEPLEFSFWMASNMPMSEEEKLCLLEMQSTVERLQYIRQKIADEERIESYIHCKSCGIPLSRATFMFSVGGAEGTTGAYVNEYGCIHQTITVREVCETEVWFQGHAETRDSWFEGYSWTIMNCVFCGSHLGWKFLRVDRRDEATLDRPDQFYGLSAASVATQGASTMSDRRSVR